MKIVSEDGHIVPNIFNNANEAKSICILAHGISADKTEGGIFDRQAEALNRLGIATLQIDFRGHGESKMPSEKMSIEGEKNDLSAAIDAVSNFQEIFLLSASFACVATGILPQVQKNRLIKICLWNPVISLQKTFVNPELPWQKANFGKHKIESALESDGSLLIDDNFKVGRQFLEEVRSMDVEEGYSEYKQPILVIHGNQDTYVSFDVAKMFCEDWSNRTFISVPGSEHGFGRSSDEKIVVQATNNFFKTG